MDYSELTPNVDPAAVVIDDVDVSKAVFVVPSDAPLPALLEGSATSGSLYERLAPLTIDGRRGIARLSGTELYALLPIWRALVAAKRVYVVHELPGARYDIPFTAASRQLGLRVVEWPQIEEAVGRQAALTQSTRDSKAWMVKEEDPAEVEAVKATLRFPGRRPPMTRAKEDTPPLVDEGDL